MAFIYMVGVTRFKTVFKTFRRFNDDIQNAKLLPYNNGRLEDMNNNIKVVKRISYSYTNFNNFKRRIMIVQGI
ncbi:transposase [Floricoccus penangensis]|uniref:transposase n=1 Tax=Floricoccus penangensis TaxID=1859475 RepID=UPI0009F17C44